MVGYGHPGASWGLWTGIIGRILGISANPIGFAGVIRLAQEYQHQAERAGQQWQHAAQNGFEAAVRSWEEFNKGWTSIAAELRDYSKNAFEDATNAWGRVLSARTLPDVVEAQSEYARKSYEKQIAQATKLGQNVRRSLRERLQES